MAKAKEHEYVKIAREAVCKYAAQLAGDEVAAASHARKERKLREKLFSGSEAPEMNYEDYEAARDVQSIENLLDVLRFKTASHYFALSGDCETIDSVQSELARKLEEADGMSRFGAIAQEAQDFSTVVQDTCDSAAKEAARLCENIYAARVLEAWLKDPNIYAALDKYSLAQKRFLIVLYALEHDPELDLRLQEGTAEKAWERFRAMVYGSMVPSVLRIEAARSETVKAAAAKASKKLEYRDFRNISDFWAALFSNGGQAGFLLWLDELAAGYYIDLESDRPAVKERGSDVEN